MFWNRKREAPSYLMPLTDQDALTLHQCYSGVLFTGGVGSGKSTIAEILALALLRAGCGFCVMVAKPSEVTRWQRLCVVANRSDDLIEFAPGGRWSCDLLDYTLSHGATASVEEAVALLDIATDLASRQQGGNSQERYWELLAQKVFRRSVATVWFGQQKASLSDVLRCIQEAPSSEAEASNPKWRAASFCYECLAKAKGRAVNQRELGLCADFWMGEWATQLGEKQRGIAYSMTTNLLDVLLSGPGAEMLSSGVTTVSPDDCLAGKIVLLAMPVLQYREPAIYFQSMFKTLVQRAVLRREVNNESTPVVLWQDEAAWFMTKEDALAQTIGRESKLISVAIVQNLPILYGALGGDEKARHESHAWVGNHATKFMASNADTETCNVQSALIGSSFHILTSGHGGPQQEDPLRMLAGLPAKNCGGWNQQRVPDFPPEKFGTLRRGGEQFNGVVDMVVQQDGAQFKANAGRPWVVTSFKQRFSL